MLVLGGCTEEPPPVAGDTGHHLMAPGDLAAFFDCLRESGGVVVSAHRGGPAPGFAENAIPTFEHTSLQGWAFLEVDVARTRDGVLVLMHDDDVERTTDGIGSVSSLTAAQFAALRLEDENGTILDAHPPTLREALAWTEDMTVLELDVKRGVSYEDVAAEVRDAGAMDRVVFITYSVDGASRLARVAPEAMIYTTITSVRDLDSLQRRGVDLSRIVAWLGTEAPDTSLTEALAARGVEARFGMFGDRRSYENVAGAEIIAVDNAANAVRALDAADGEEGYAALQCAAAQ
jgi:glycerophosphoryl diester phosphodiesterase